MLLQFYNYLSDILFSAFKSVDSLPVRVVFKKPMLSSDTEPMDDIFDEQNRRSGVILTPKNEVEEKYGIFTLLLDGISCSYLS